MGRPDLPRPASRSAAFGGFTMIELLVVIVVVGVLAGTLLPALARARRSAFKTRELSAAQQLMAAYTLYSDDNRGTLMPGYAPAWMVSANPAPGQPQIEVFDDNSQAVHGVRAQRYPWRIAPYLNYDMAGLYKDDNVLRRYRERSDFQYIISLSPSLGLNADFVGGKAEPGFGFNRAANEMWGNFYVTRSDQARRPERLIVFASSRGVDPDGGPAVEGFYEVDSPYLLDRRWAVNDQAADAPESLGFVSPRYENKAVVSCFDGHSETFAPADLDDMTRWSNQATRGDWTLESR